jgi:hypothetical protein
VRSVPAQPGTISGPSSNLCGGGTFTYSVTAVTGATSYNWTVPSNCSIAANNGNSISLVVPSNFTTGSLSVIASNACGNSTARSLSLTRLPSTPASITGPASVCANQQNVGFSVTATSGLTYTWTVPSGASIVSGQGTSAVVVNFGATAGNVGVKANNSCGSSSTRTKAVSIAPCRLGDELAEQAGNSEWNNAVIFPNPGYGNITIASLNIDEDAVLRVFTANGQLLRNEVIPANTETWMLNLETEAKGLYLIQIETKEGAQNLRYVKD